MLSKFYLLKCKFIRYIKINQYAIINKIGQNNILKIKIALKFIDNYTYNDIIQVNDIYTKRSGGAEMGSFMSWLNNWWDGLKLIEQILYCIAVPSTLILLIDTVIMIIGAGVGGEGVNPSDTSGIDFDGDTDFGGGFHFDGDGCPGDIHHGGDFDTDISNGADFNEAGSPSDLPAMKLFTVQGTVAFLTVFGWTSLICYHQGLNILIALLIGFAAGFAVMYAMAKIFQSFKKLVQSGTLNYRNALGLEGTVYIPIPPKSQGSGKVNVTIQGSLRECDAITEGFETIPTGAGVRVVDVIGNTLVVERSL